MLLILMYLTQTEKATKLTEDPAFTTLLISAAYITAMNLGYSVEIALSPSPLNPAIAVGLILAQLFAGYFSVIKMTWIYCVFAFAGALLSVISFEFIYKKSIPNQAKDDSVEEDQVEQEENLVSPMQDF